MYSKFSGLLSDGSPLMWLICISFGRGPRNASATSACTYPRQRTPSTDTVIKRRDVPFFTKGRNTPPVRKRPWVVTPGSRRIRPRLDASILPLKRGTTFQISVMALVMLCSVAKVNAVELDRFAIEYGRFHPSGRFPEMPGYIAKETIAAVFDIGLIGPVYWRNRVKALTDPGQYRQVSWQFELGADPFFWQGDLKGHLEVFYAHHSQHLLEGQHPWMKFPVNDQLGLRWTIYRRTE